MATAESSPGPTSDSQQLWDELQEKDAELAQVQKRLEHYRAWVGTLHAKMQASNPQAIKNAKRLYIGGVPEGTTDVSRPLTVTSPQTRLSSLGSN
jgi:hypothetical protein